MIGMLRESILHNQTLTMNCVASTFNDYKKRSNMIRGERVHRKHSNQIEKLCNLQRSVLLKSSNSIRGNVLQFSVT